MLRKATTILAGLAIIAPVRMILHSQFDGLDETIEVCQQLISCKIPYSKESDHEARKMAALVHDDNKVSRDARQMANLCDSPTVNGLLKLTKGLAYHPLAHFVCFLGITPDNFVNAVTCLTLLALKGLQLLLSARANPQHDGPNEGAPSHGAERLPANVDTNGQGGEHELEPAGHAQARRRLVGRAPFGTTTLLLFGAVGLADFTVVHSQSTAVAVRHDKVLVPAALHGKHSEYSAGIPPCSRSCKPVPMVCVDEGYFTSDQYVYWEQDGSCEHIKTNIPAGVTKMAADSVLWSMVGSVVWDGRLGLDDVANIFVAYKFSDIQKEKILEADTLRKLASKQAKLALLE